jgi:adenylate cyclase
LKRKLTTVLCADAQNYSRMMAQDETATLQRLNRYRSIMDGLFARHDGRTVNTWGDGVIAEFASVVEAVRCAVEVQDAITAENRDLPEEMQMWFRIGINLGDVMEENGDFYGDGVNMAARLEALAEPGGIMVSESVYNFTHKQLAIGFDYAGENKVKDSDVPIVGYRVRSGQNRPPGQQKHAANEEPQTLFNSSEDLPEKRLLDAIGARIGSFREWFDSQDKGVKFSVLMIGFFFGINFLFSGIAQPWFIFPSLPFALYIYLRRRKERPTEIK